MKNAMLTLKKMWFFVFVLVIFTLSSLAVAHSDESRLMNLSNILEPLPREEIAFEPVRVVVQLDASAEPGTFQAWLNGTQVSSQFSYDETENQMIGIVGPEDGLRVKNGCRNRQFAFYGLNLFVTKVESSFPKRSLKKRSHSDLDMRLFFVNSEGLTRDTEYGVLRGAELIQEGGPEDGAAAFAWLGVPYAAPPVGDLRWRAPQNPRSWEGVRMATERCSNCVQPEYDSTWLSNGSIVGNEDCLYMNIYRPKTSEANLPVYLFIHGGANIFGSSDDYEGIALASRGNMIVVMINYRLNAMGWMAHPALRDEENALDGSGNYGTLDTIKALQWIRENISNFGGDPENITVGGQSAGAHNTTNLIVSPLSAGLFQKAVLQSNSMTLLSLEEGDERTNRTIEYLLVADGIAGDMDGASDVRLNMSSSELKVYLKNKSPEEIILAQNDVNGGASPFHEAFRDGTVIPDATWEEMIAAGNYNKVPMLMGNTEDEWNAFMPHYGPAAKAYFNQPSGVYNWFDLYRAIEGSLSLSDVLPTDRDKEIYRTAGKLRSKKWKFEYNDSLARLFKENSPENPLYNYVCKWSGGGEPEPCVEAFDFTYGSGHASDISLFQGANHDAYYLGSFTQHNEPGRFALQRIMMDYISNFISSGDPNSSGLPYWPQWSNTDGEPKGISLDADLSDAVVEPFFVEINDEFLRTEIESAYMSYPEAAGIFYMFDLHP